MWPIHKNSCLSQEAETATTAKRFSQRTESWRFKRRHQKLAQETKVTVIFQGPTAVEYARLAKNPARHLDLADFQGAWSNCYNWQRTESAQSAWDSPHCRPAVWAPLSQRHSLCCQKLDWRCNDFWSIYPFWGRDQFRGRLRCLRSRHQPHICPVRLDSPAILGGLTRRGKGEFWDEG